MFIVYFLSPVLSWVNYFSKRTSVSALLWACDWLTQERQCSWPEWKGWGSVFLREGSRLWENISRMWPQQKLGNWGFQWSFLIYSLFHFLTACLCLRPRYAFSLFSQRSTIWAYHILLIFSFIHGLLLWCSYCEWRFCGRGCSETNLTLWFRFSLLGRQKWNPCILWYFSLL